MFWQRETALYPLVGFLNMISRTHKAEVFIQLPKHAVSTIHVKKLHTLSFGKEVGGEFAYMLNLSRLTNRTYDNLIYHNYVEFVTSVIQLSPQPGMPIYLNGQWSIAMNG